MGFNSTRRYRDGKWNDIILFVVFLLILIPSLLWAFGVFG